MKAPLRSHPKLSYKGRCAWPPPSGLALDPAQWAAAVLRSATIFRTGGYGGLPDHLKLQIVHHGRSQIADLWVDDASVLVALRDFLNKRRDLSLDQIGELDIDL